MYLDAMLQVGANTDEINNFIKHIYLFPIPINALVTN